MVGGGEALTSVLNFHESFGYILKYVTLCTATIPDKLLAAGIMSTSRKELVEKDSRLTHPIARNDPRSNAPYVAGILTLWIFVIALASAIYPTAGLV